MKKSGFKDRLLGCLPVISRKQIVGYTLLSSAGATGSIYLGGVIGQFIGNYQEYLAGGHLFDISGQAKIAWPDFDFTPSFLYALRSSYGHTGLLVVCAGVGGLIAYIVYRNHVESKDSDGRGFLQSKKGTYGTSGWMDEVSFRKVLDWYAPYASRGIPLGMRDGKVVSLPDGAKNRLNRNIAVFGTPGCGKTRCFVLNQILYAVVRGESVICTDTKGELYEKTASYLRKQGYTVKLFNLVEFDHSDGWNCLREVAGSQTRAQLFVDTIMKNTSDGKDDQFWSKAEMNMLKALVLYVCLDPARSEEEKTLGAIYQLLCNCKDAELEAMFHALPYDHPARMPYNLYEMAAGNDKVTGGVRMGLGARLQVLQDVAVRDLLAHDDLDLALPAKEKCAYFIRISDQDSTFQFLSSLLFSFLFIDIIKYADTRPNRTCDVPVNFVLDEFPNIGEIPDFTKKLSTVRSRDVAVSVIFQGIPQLKNRYQMDQWREILDDCDTSLFLGANGDMTTEYVSKQSGVISVDVDSEAAELNRFRLTDYTHSFRKSSGVGKRMLLNPDEVRCLENSNLIVILRGQKPLKLDKFDYSKNPESKKLHDVKIIDYDPGWEPQKPVSPFISKPKFKTLDNGVYEQTGQSVNKPEQTDSASDGKSVLTEATRTPEREVRKKQARRKKTSKDKSPYQQTVLNSDFFATGQGAEQTENVNDGEKPGFESKSPDDI